MKYSKKQKVVIETWQKLAGVVIKEQEEIINEKRKIFVLVGPPSAGKSTWISNTFSSVEDKPYIINRDDIAEDVAEANGWTYDDMFITPPAGSVLGDIDEKYGKVVPAPSWMSWTKTVFSRIQGANGRVQHLFEQRVDGAIGSGKDIIIDMTNMTTGARKAALKAINGSESEFEKIAVVFQFQGAEGIIKKIAQKRAEAAKRMGKSKTIPDAAFERMFASFQEVSPSEGFDKILSVDNRSAFKKIVGEGLQLEQNSVPQTSSPHIGTPNARAVQNRAKMSQQPAQPAAFDPSSVEGRKTILKELIASAAEITRAGNNINKALTKVQMQDQVDEGLIPFLQDLGVYVEGNIVSLRDKIIPKAYQELKEISVKLLNLAKKQKAERDSTSPPPVPQPAQAPKEAARQEINFAKKSLKEVFNVSEDE